MNFRIALPAMTVALFLGAPAFANTDAAAPSALALSSLAAGETGANANDDGIGSPKAVPKKKSKQMDAQEFSKMAKMLGDPRMQKDISKMVEGFAAAMMEMPVGKMAAAIEEARPGSIGKSVPANATVADLAGKDARDLPHEFGAQSKDMMGMMGGMLSAFAIMLPEFEKMGREIADKMPHKN
jgi:hypothetical protein